jgi:hypothetical protein
MIKRARELAAAGCDPRTIETLLTAEEYTGAGELMTEGFVKELEQIAVMARHERKDTR